MSPNVTKGVGAALTFTEQRTGFFTTTKTTFITPTTTVAQMVENNADRLELIVFNMGTDDLIIHFDPSISITNGFRIPQSGGFLVFKVKDDFTLVGQNWFLRAVTTSTTVTVVEVVRILNAPSAVT